MNSATSSAGSHGAPQPSAMSDGAMSAGTAAASASALRAYLSPPSSAAARRARRSLARTSPLK